MEITLDLDVTIKLPKMPNFIQATSNPDRNSTQDHSFDVADLKDEHLQKIGEEWTKELILHAKNRRKIKKIGDE